MGWYTSISYVFGGEGLLDAEATRRGVEDQACEDQED